MRAYVITLMDMPDSVRLAQRCVESANKFDIDAQIYQAVDRHNAQRLRLSRELFIGSLTEQYADPLACLGCFMSMYLLWEQIRDSGQMAIILEHDAVFTAPMPDYAYGDVVNLARPSYGEFVEKNHPGLYPLFSKEGGYFPGSHGYLVSPSGAAQLIQKAHADGVHAADLYLSKSRFPQLQEIYPWIIEAKSEFSTIQNLAGARAQHAFQASIAQGIEFKTAEQIWRCE